MEKAIAQHIEERLNEMTTDCYSCGPCWKSDDDLFGHYVGQHCEHVDGYYEYEEYGDISRCECKSIDKNLRKREWVGIYADYVTVNHVKFYRNYGKRKGQWRGYILDEERNEVVKINVTSEMKKALDKISTLPIK